MKTKKEKLFKVHEVEQTPFNVLEKEEKFKIILGNEIISPAYDTLEEAKKQIEKNPEENMIFALTRAISMDEVLVS